MLLGPEKVAYQMDGALTGGRSLLGVGSVSDSA
jgi:hypothetical protein